MAHTTDHIYHANFYIIFIIISSSLVIEIPAVSSIRPLLANSSYEEYNNNTLCTNAGCIATASSDYGKMVQELPFGVLQPSSVSEIAHLVKYSYNSSSPFTIGTRGNGHSIRGQAMAKDGVVVDMAALRRANNGIKVLGNSSSGLFYTDVGGEQLWIDVLRATLEHGLAPVSWTDYLYLTVGGTLSNAGISGQSAFHGPQISNVLEMDVITGKGELMTCSKSMNPDLFYGVLGGLGQFGIITRARIVLNKAPTRVKWYQIIYDDFSKFTKDQERLISTQGIDYVEGFLITASTPASSFFSPSVNSLITSLASKNGVLYSLEVVKYIYDDQIINTVEEVLQVILKGLSFSSGLIFNKDAPIIDFLDRVRGEELLLTSLGLWDVPHPWLSLFVPRSRIVDFNKGVLVDIIQKQSLSTGPFIVYPFNRNKWDDEMSVVIPEDEDDMFYVVDLLNAAGGTIAPATIDKQNAEILEYCSKNGIKIKQYLPHYTKKEEWMKHFGKKWSLFKQRKNQFDPKMILSPGQRIFTNSD
uniref:cytokinin dehydrogenase 2-like n=1 Tax=Erigeron canadensis TaxID=72917 RepID=UPI001CB9BE45|nr:cytokinin dehydrogenase 2-like [Erigeron canadensis]